MARVLIAGCGYVGRALAAALVADGHAVWGLSRRPAILPDGVQPIAADLCAPETLTDLPPDLDAVAFLAAPGGSDDDRYRRTYVEGLANLLRAAGAAGRAPARAFFVSSTAVYAQDDGAWVDEDSATEPTHFSGRRLLEAEAVLRDGAPVTCAIRLGGIYGPGRTRLIESVRAGRAVYRTAPPQYTNRIHRDDCAGVLRHLLAVPDPADVYLGVDCEPARDRDVQRLIAAELKAPTPRGAAADDPALRTARGNKRCRNDRLLASGYAFRYPTYREGDRAVIRGLS